MRTGVVPRRNPAPYSAERTEAGGWRITLPLEAVPSKNAIRHEHWSARKRRVDAIAVDLFWLRAYHRIPSSAPVFGQARMTLTLYFRRAGRRDPGNYGPGAGAACLVDALVRTTWLGDDDAEHLTCAEPVLCVDRQQPRAVVTLEPWDGRSGGGGIA
jgi:hypothetical protein